MRLHVQHFNLRAPEPDDSWVRTQILSLGKVRQIDAAHIRLIRLLDSSPAYHVRVHLVTPGPDVVAEERDHTLRAAFGKVMRRIRDEIRGRAEKRLLRAKSNLKSRRAA